MVSEPSTPAPSPTPATGRVRHREYATWVPLRLLDELKDLEPATRVFFLFVRCITRKAKWPPRPARLAEVVGVSAETAAYQLQLIQKAGYFTDQWLRRGVFTGPVSYVSIRMLRILAGLKLSAERQLQLIRLLPHEEGGWFMWKPSLILEDAGVPKEEAKAAELELERLELLSHDGPVAEFLRPVFT